MKFALRGVVLLGVFGVFFFGYYTRQDYIRSSATSASSVVNQPLSLQSGLGTLSSERQRYHDAMLR